MQQLPQKDVYKLSEVCRFTDTQPYVLRFWESEFPQLSPGKSASGQRLYKKKDIAVVCRIKELLYAESRSVAEARQQLADELAKGKRLKLAPPPPPAAAKTDEAEAAAEKTAPAAAPVVKSRPAARSTSERSQREAETVSRQRYEDAVDEIDHLRMALREAEKNVQRAESAAERAAERVEQALELLS